MSENEARKLRLKALAELEASDLIEIIRDMVYAEQERELQHAHKWRVAGVNPPDDASVPRHPRASFLPGMSGQVTDVLLICHECNWPMSIRLTGFWTKEQITGGLNASNPTSD